MEEIRQEEAGYAAAQILYFSVERGKKERILYKNFVQVGMDVKEMIKDVVNRRGAK